MLNELGDEKYFSGFLNLGNKLIQSGLNVLIALVIGMQVIEGMILPQADAIKNQALIKAVSVIPGIGGVTGTMSGALLGSGVLIRNGIGLTAMIILVFICLIPLCQMVMTNLLIQLVLAVMTPIADKKMLSGVNKLSQSFSILIKVMTYCLCIFLIVIACVCAMTRNGV
ncbi:hypothetical protein P261_02834 [Lachnospiraceae bacterium TWA4]|nr:hypothetical protein P261_02834 [Lachnospiraceae bacterium TWA4]